MTRSRLPIALALLPLAALALLSPTLHADRVITKDGRVIKPQKARKEGEGHRLFFEAGEIFVPPGDLISSVEIEGDMSDYVPQNDDEREKLEMGYVRYRGRWMSKSLYENELRKEFEESKARLEELDAHSDWRNAWVNETRHFVVRSNTSPELLKYYSDLIEAYYSLMDKRIGIDPTPELRRSKMDVNIWRSKDEFHKYSGEDERNVLGFFMPVVNNLNFYHNYEEPGESDWVALHECTHLLTYMIDQQFRPQIWINEAVADFFGSADISIDDRGKVTITPGKLQTDRVLTVQQAIKDGNSTTLDTLFHLEKPAFDGFQYAHAWSFVYFLNNFEDGKYQKGFNKFFKDLYTTGKGVPVKSVPSWGKSGTGKEVAPDDIKELLLNRIKVKDAVELERQWKEYIAAVPIEGPEARLKRGINATWRGEFAAALPDLDAAIDAGTTNPRAYAARASARAFGGGGRDGVLEDLKKAVELDPLSAVYRLRYSQALVGLVAFGPIDISSRDDDDLKGLEDEEAKMHAGLALALAPESDNDMFLEWFKAFK